MKVNVTQALLAIALLLAAIPDAAGQTLASIARLAAASAELRAIAAAGGWPTIPAGAALHEGEEGARVRALRRRLALTDGADPAGGAVFDDGLRRAVERAQQRHGLAVDGVAGRDTLAALNRPVEDRLVQIDVNLARLSKLPPLDAGPHILVNAAAFQLTLLEDGVATLAMKVIVGRPDRATPEFDSTVGALILNPDWTVPVRIARRDILARIRRDPGYFEREGFVVYESWAAGARQLDPATIDWRRLPAGFPYKLRQLPGPTNALGRIKFVLSSPYDIYMHDTPAKDLFRRPVRAFSNGCIRLADPFALADRLMQDPGWPERRDTALANGRTETIALPRSVPVHIVYFSAWVDDDGMLNLRDDIYGRDRQAEAALVAAAVSAQIGCGPQAG